MSILGDNNTPIEREDGPEAADVPPTDPSGRVDDEDMVQAPDDDGLGLGAAAAGPGGPGTS